MIKLQHKTLIAISGIIWMVVGCFLLFFGLNLLVGGILPESGGGSGNYPLLDWLTPFAGARENGALVLIVFGLYAGYLKGRHVLGKSARKGIARIRSFSNPTSLSNVYSRGYYILLAGMIALGISIKYMGIPGDVRGTIDVAIGAALINGAVIYFKGFFYDRT